MAFDMFTNAGLFHEVGMAGLTVLVSFIVSRTFVATAKKHLAVTSRSEDTVAVQSMHSAPTPRLGGIGLFLAMIMGTVLMPHGFGAGGRERIVLLLLSSVPIFVAGLLEDMGIRLSPAVRLAAGFLSSALAMLLLTAWIPRLGIVGLDHLIALAPIGIAFTIFGAGGVIHGLNLIDGLNGLAAGFTTIAALGLMLVALSANVNDVALAALLVAATTIGFLPLNWPHGRIFLGDAGAYLLGHMLAWLAILLIQDAPDLTPWSALLILFWPIADTLLAIWRRRTKGASSARPDRLHVHQLLMRGLEIRLLGRKRRQLANPLAAVLLLPAIAAPVVSGVLFSRNAAAAIIMTLLYAVLFFGSYIFVASHLASARKRRKLLGFSMQSAVGQAHPHLSSTTTD